MLTSINSRRQEMTKHQAGMTLIELMVAMVVSLIVTGAMVAVMANTLGTGTRTINMTHLTQQLRTAMQIMSRDLRRANYLVPAQAISCIQNVNCLTDLGISNKVGIVEIGDDTDGDGFGECFSFWLDRDSNGSVERTGFRLAVTSGVGRIEILTDDTSTSLDANNCPNGTWVAITDPDTIDVNSFDVDDSDVYNLAINTGGATLNVQKIRLELDAELVSTGNVGYAIRRVIGDEIRVRNDYTSP